MANLVKQLQVADNSQVPQVNGIFASADINLLLNIANQNANSSIRIVIGRTNTMAAGNFTIFLFVINQTGAVLNLNDYEHKFVAPCPPICGDQTGGKDIKYKFNIETGELNHERTSFG